MSLEWNWLCLPYVVCALALIGAGVVAAAIQGDRVLRIGALGASTTALPWALCSGVVTWTDDPTLAARLLRLGNGPVALVGPSLMLVLLGASGQLERFRYLARVAGVFGLVSLALCWSTDLVVGGVHELSSGVFYISPGPLTAVHFATLGLWLVIGMVIAGRSMSSERRQLKLLLVAVSVLGAVGSVDLLLVYGVTDGFPIAWLPAGIAGGLAVYYQARSDLLRPQGVDHRAVVEILALAGATAVMATLLIALEGAAPVALATVASATCTVSLGVAWTRREVRVRRTSERAFEEFAATVTELDAEATIADRLAELWRRLGIEMLAFDRIDGEQLFGVVPAVDTPRPLDTDVATWFVERGDALSTGDLGTMLLGALRPKLEALVASRRATLIVPLIDRGTLVGLIEADHSAALREGDRGLVLESARAAARALTYVALADTAARERENAREVEVAEAMRLQASASRDDELGRWAVAAEYRSATRTTGAGWAATLLPDGRLAVLVTEAQAHGVAAAFATSALTGAFTGATHGAAAAAIDLDDLLGMLRASAEGVVRGGEPVAAFVAILDGAAHTITWAAAGHPGAAIVGPIDPSALRSSDQSGAHMRPDITPLVELGGGGERLGASLVTATRGVTALPAGALVVVASSGLRSVDGETWRSRLRGASLAGSRLAAMVVDLALADGPPNEDLLAVVLRER